MSNRMTSRWLSLAVLLLLLLALALPGRATSATAQAKDEPLPTKPMRLESSDSSRLMPAIQSSPLLDKWHAQGGGKPGATLSDPKVIGEVQRQAVRSHLSSDIESNSQVVRPSSQNLKIGIGITGSTEVLPAGQTAIPDEGAAPLDFRGPIFGANAHPSSSMPQAIAPQSQTFNCVQELADPQINNIVGGIAVDWPVYARKGYWTPDNSYSLPNALAMIEYGSAVYGGIDNNDDIFDTSRGTDIDAMGQPLTVPADAPNLTVQFKFRYDPGSAGSNDRLYYEFYYQNGNNLGNYIDGRYVSVAPQYANGAYWTQTETFDDPAFLNAVRGQQIVLVISTYNTNDGLYSVVRLDDIYAEICYPGIIQGQVTQFGASAVNSGPQAGPSDLSDALLLLTYQQQPSSPLQIVELTVPDAAGNYQFTGIPELPAGGQYRVWYLNYSLTDTIDDSRLSIYLGPAIASLAQSEIVTAPSFDITDVHLLSPAPYDQVITNESTLVDLTWQARGIPGDEYKVCMYDRQTIDPATNSPAEVCSVDFFPPGNTVFHLAPSSFPASFNFRYGHEYSWYIEVFNGGRTQLGISYYEHAITFESGAETPPNNPPPSDPNPPPSNSSASWTVMVYMAGDNSLGDTLRTTSSQSNYQGQFESLKQLAGSYPNVNLVTLTDFYGNTGTQFCYLSPSAGPQCQELGEQDTADPAVLTNFINKALSLYPAPHTMLVIADHGHSITGVATDETTPDEPSMTPDQVRQAFDGANLSSRKLDVLFYDTCLMGTFETASDASSYANYMVAASDEIWVINIFDRVLPLLSSPDGGVVASGIVSAYNQAVDAVIPGVYKSMAAYDLSKVAAVNGALSTLAQAISADIGAVRTNLATIRAQVQVYDSSGNNLVDQIYDSSGVNVVAEEEDAFVDLRDLATRLQGIGNANIATAATTLLDTMGGVGNGGLVIASVQASGSNDEGASKDLSSASGLAVYFPNGERGGGQLTLTDAYLYRGAFAQYNGATQWDDFLRTYLSGIVSQGGGGVARGPSRIGRGGRPVAGHTIQRQKLFLPLVVR